MIIVMFSLGALMTTCAALGWLCLNVSDARQRGRRD